MRIVYTSQFKRDYKKLERQRKDLQRLRVVIEKIAAGETLERRYRDHQLIGKFKGYRDCHIGPDWLLLYRKTSDTLILERSGSHSDLFKK